jgi:hypothetical protein
MKYGYEVSFSVIFIVLRSISGTIHLSLLFAKDI